MSRSPDTRMVACRDRWSSFAETDPATSFTAFRMTLTLWESCHV